MAEHAYRVAVIGPLFEADPGGERERLEKAGVTIVTGKGGTEAEVLATCAEADVVMCFGGVPFSERVFAGLPRLGLLQQCSVGYDRVDVAAATRHGVMVANSPRFCSEEVADHAAMLILACARKLSHQIYAASRHGWNRPAAVAQMGPIYRVMGKTLGFVAFGRIARRTAEKLSGFGLRYLAYDPYLQLADVRAWNVELVSLDELCRRADFVSMHALLNSATRRMFGETQFRAMKPTAYFVNTSRGGAVDEAALIRALREGWIAGAGLDVLEKEPPEPDNPLLGLANVLLTPHTAGYSVDSLAENCRDTVGEVLRVLAGEWPSAFVNPEVKPAARFRRIPSAP
ncbi:MAG TPA: C-terminal binding protein [Methylomirabilota bacterium]|jgi:D-3-phosphoglycerate dehydrogenase|nr:C-terminal binding protein [Methylomirabilota bacterium]